MSKKQEHLTDAQADGLLSLLRTHAVGMQVQAGPWSRTAGALLDLVLQAKCEQAAATALPIMPAPSLWFTRMEVEALCVSAPSASVKAKAIRWIRGLPGNAQYAPGESSAWSSAAEEFFAQIQTLVAPAVAELTQYLAHDLGEGFDFVYIDGKHFASAGMSELADELFAERGRLSGESAPRFGARLKAVPAAVRAFIGQYRNPRTWPNATWSTLRRAYRATLSFAKVQATEIRAELKRALRPAVKVRVLKDYGIALTASKQHGGSTVLMPIRNAASSETLGASIEATSDGFAVAVYGEAAVDGHAALRVVRWKVAGLQDRLAAEQLVKRIEGAMVAAAGGGSPSIWPKAIAFAVIAVVAVGLLSANPSKREAPAAQAAAGQGAVGDANAALAALFGAPANATPVNGEEIPADVMAAVLAGAGMDPEAAAQLQAGATDDPWVAEAMASARQVAQQTIYQQGAVGTPAPDPSLKEFGLGNSIAGCDPALSFKVSE